MTMMTDPPPNRRKDLRFVCDGTAEVLGAQGGLQFRGKILNLSLSGCYLQTAPPMRLERGSHVEILFQLNGLAFRVAATLAAQRASGGSGYLFTRLSPRTQEQMETLIHELSSAGQNAVSTLPEANL